MCTGKVAPKVYLFDGYEISQELFANKSNDELHDRVEVLEVQSRTTSPYLLTPMDSYAKTHGPCSRVAGVIVVALLVGAIAAFVLSATGHLETLPQDFWQGITHPNWTHLAIGGGITAVFLGGAIIVIFRAVHRKERLLSSQEGIVPFEEIKKGHGRGVFRNIDKHVLTVRLGAFPTQKQITENEKKQIVHGWEASPTADIAGHAGYIDRSTLDKKGNGKAYLYGYKSCGDHYQISTVVAVLGSPAYLIGTIFYNVITLVVFPLYLLGMWGAEKIRICMGKGLFYKDDPFTLAAIPREIGRSLKGIVRAPFYALAYQMASFYSIANPLGGRKLAAAIERDWNDDVPLSQGIFYAGMQEQPLYTSSWAPSQLRRKGLYFAGCWQPLGVATFKEGVITGCNSLERSVDPQSQKAKEGKEWYTYKWTTHEEAVLAQKEYDQLKEQIKALEKKK